MGSQRWGPSSTQSMFAGICARYPTKKRPARRVAGGGARKLRWFPNFRRKPLMSVHEHWAICEREGACRLPEPAP